MSGNITASLLVIEIGRGAAAAYCGWMFAQAGHTVVLIEPPGGHPLRDEPAAAVLSHERRDSPLFLTLAAGKQSVVLDLEQRADIAELRRLLGAADVLVTDGPDPLVPAGLTNEVLQALAPRLIHASVTPFGESGPYAGFAATSATLYALGGHTYITGEADREPLSGPEYFPEFLAGATAFAAANAALVARERSGLGDRVEVSALECLVAGHQFTLTRHSYQGRTLERTGNRYASLVGVNFYPCADGVAALAASSQAQLDQLFLLTGCETLIGDTRFNAVVTTDENAAIFDEHIGPWFAARSREDAVAQCQAFRIPCAPVLEVDEVLNHPQLRAREFWRSAQVAGGKELLLPRLPFRLRGELPEAKAAPALGVHEDATRMHPVPAAIPTAEPSLPRGAPLANTRILDLTRVWSGPVTTRMLADLGAEVIKIEYPGSRGPLGPDGGASQAWNRNGLFNELNRNKRSVAMDLGAMGAREAFLGLAAQVDVVIENFSPRVMGNLGIDFETLRALNPGVIMVSMPGYGLSGPMRDGVAYGTTVDAEAGTASIAGYAGEGPMRMGVAFPDYVAGVHAAGATMAALHERAYSGAGQHVDLSQFESISAFMSSAVVEYQVTGVRPARTGNARARFALQGIYRCRDSNWVAITASTADECARLGEHVGGQENLDRDVAAWVAQRQASDVMSDLQAIGIAAGRVLSGPDLFADPHLTARDFFVELEHPLVGRHLYPGVPFRMAGLSRAGWTDAPRLGADNVEVLRSMLGYDEAAITQLYAHGAIADRPPG